MSRRLRLQLKIYVNDVRYSYGYFETEEEREEAREKHEKRIAIEQKEGHIIGSRGEVLRSRFKIDGKTYEIVGSESYGKKVIESIDNIKNVETKELKDVKRIELFNLTRKK